jgi:hypothetical protein
MIQPAVQQVSITDSAKSSEPKAPGAIRWKMALFSHW